MPFRFNPFTDKLDLTDVSSSPSGSISFLTGNTGGAVPGDASQNINVVGASGIVVTGNPGTNTLTITPNGAIIGQTITGQSGGALSPVAGNWNIFGASVASGTAPAVTSGSGNTLTLNVQRSQAIASTNATNIGLSAFNSAQFSVDANGFVSSNGSGFIWIDQATGITLAINRGYFVTAATTQTLPAAPSQGDTVKIICDTTGAVVVTANTGQTIRLGNTASSSAGTFTSTARGDALELIYRAATTQWLALNSVGNWAIA